MATHNSNVGQKYDILVSVLLIFVLSNWYLKGIATHMQAGCRVQAFCKRLMQCKGCNLVKKLSWQKPKLNTRC